MLYSTKNIFNLYFYFICSIKKPQEDITLCNGLSGILFRIFFIFYKCEINYAMFQIRNDKFYTNLL